MNTIDNIKIASDVQEILKRIYNNIKDEEFDENVDFSGISEEAMRNFFVNTAGFIGLHNFETSTNNYSDEECDEILKGNFILKVLSQKEYSEYAKKYHLKGSQNKYDLYKIQDGVYSIKKFRYPDNSGYFRCLCLKTNNAEVHISQDFQDKKGEISPSETYKMIRNAIVHGEIENTIFNENFISQYIADKIREEGKQSNKSFGEISNEKGVSYFIEKYIINENFNIQGNQITFKIKSSENPYYIMVSKMWLRGYAEMFTRNFTSLEPENISSSLKKVALETNNELSSIDDINKLLSAIMPELKEAFEENKNFHFVNSFVNERLKYYKDFFKKPFHEKIEILALICAKNPSYLKSSLGSINPSFLYTMQRLVSSKIPNPIAEIEKLPINKKIDRLLELNRENKLNPVFTIFFRSLNDAYTKRIIEYNKKLDDLSSQSEKLKKGSHTSSGLIKTFNVTRNTMEMLIKNYKRSIMKLIEADQLESSVMNFYESDSLTELPVEIAVNIIALLAYNNLVTSGFFETYLNKRDFSKFSKEQREMLSKINVGSSIANMTSNRQNQITSAIDKAYFLTTIRNAICHGQVRYSVLTRKKAPTFKDVRISFFTYDKNMGLDEKTISNYKECVSGTVEDFYKMLTSIPFMPPEKDGPNKDNGPKNE